MTSKIEMWIHGSAVQVAYPDDPSRISSFQRRGAFTQIGPGPTAPNFLYFLVPTPTIVDGVGAKLASIMFVLKVPSTLFLKSIAVIDGDVVLSGWPDGDLHYEPMSESRHPGRHLIRLVLPTHPKVSRGVCIQVEIIGNPDWNGEPYEFAAAGCEFTY